MIERFRKEIDWESPDYPAQVTNLFKQMLLDYVRDYRARGEAALIEYNDKRNEVSLAREQRALAGASSYINDALADQKSGLQLIEDAIVWSKIKFGLKPVLADQSYHDLQARTRCWTTSAHRVEADLRQSLLQRFHSH